MGQPDQQVPKLSSACGWNAVPLQTGFMRWLLGTERSASPISLAQQARFGAAPRPGASWYLTSRSVRFEAAPETLPSRATNRVSKELLKTGQFLALFRKKPSS